MKIRINIIMGGCAVALLIFSLILMRSKNSTEIRPDQDENKQGNRSSRILTSSSRKISSDSSKIRLPGNMRSSKFFDYTNYGPLDDQKWREIKTIFSSLHSAREAPSKKIDNPLEGLLQIMKQHSMQLTNHGYNTVSKTSNHYLYVKNIDDNFSKGFAVRESDGKVFTWDVEVLNEGD